MTILTSIKRNYPDDETSIALKSKFSKINSQYESLIVFGRAAHFGKLVDTEINLLLPCKGAIYIDTYYDVLKRKQNLFC